MAEHPLLIKERVSTGVEGLDQLVEGGFPYGGTVLVCGAPGVGKTVFCMQFLHNGATGYGEPGVYVTLDQNPAKVFDDARRFGWDMAHLEQQGLLRVVDASLVRGEFSLTPNNSREEFSARGLDFSIRRAAAEIGARRIAIDPISNLLMRYSNDFERRLETMRLVHFTELYRAPCTLLCTAELTRNALLNQPNIELYSGDGLLLLDTILQGQVATHVLQILKMRRTIHTKNFYVYRIADKGITVFPSEQVYTAGLPSA